MNNRASVLIFILIIISFCIGIALTVNENAIDSYSLSNEVKDYIQSSIYASTAAKGIAQLIKEDDKKYDSKFDSWAQIPGISIENGYITVRVIPVNSKISLSNLTSSNERIKSMTEFSLIDFFEKNDFESPMAIKDWIDNDSDISQGGLEDWEYENNGLVFRTKNGNLDTLYELNYILKDKIYNKIKNVFTSVNYGSKININFVSEDVLNFWLPELEKYSSEIIAYRQNNIYKDVSQIRKAVDISQDLYVKVAPYLTEKSSFFYVIIEVNLNGFSRYYHSLIERKSSKVNLISFFEGANELYY